jgi:molybdopterin-guanine dinucleotide biosynthesis protein A
MLLDAIVLAGGRSSRLSGAPKAELRYQGQTLLSRSVDAALAAGARRVVVVGGTDDGLPDAVLVTREDPPFGGPAAGIAAGAAALAAAESAAGHPTSDFLVVLACDMPEAAAATRALATALADHSDTDGVIAIDAEQHPQPLAAIYRTQGLAEAIAHHRRTGALDGLSARALVSGLRLVPVAVPGGSTDDIDTWEDAARHGIPTPDDLPTATPEPPAPAPKGPPVSDASADDSTKPDRDDQDRLLAEWAARLSGELGLDGLDVDIDAVLGLAGKAAHAVVRPAAPLTTFLVGYAAGQASAVEPESPAEAFESARAAALRVIAERAAEAGGSAV